MTINKWLRYIIYGGIFAIPFIPLYVSSSMFFPFITGKNFAFRIIVEIIFALWAILALQDKTARPKRSYLLYSVLALVVIDGLATAFSLNLYRSFWSNYERMDGYINILHLGAYFLVLISVFKEKINWFWLANISLLANVYIAVYGFVQLAGKADIHQGGVRLDATLGNSAYLAVYVLFHIFIAGYLLLERWSKDKLISAWYILMIVADAIILYFTATRGAILGLVGGVFVVSLIMAILSKGKTRKIAVGLILAVVLFVGGFLAIKNTDFVKSSPVLSRFSSISMSDGTTKSRFMIWNMSWQGFKEHPVLGWGPENYSMVFSKYYNPGMYGQEPWFDRSHNIFFDWLVNAGILGLLSYLSIYVGLLYYIWFGRKKKIGDEVQKENKNNSDKKSIKIAIIDTVLGKSVLTGLIVAYFFHNIFVFDNLISYILFFSLIAFVHFESVENVAKENIVPAKNYKNADDNLATPVTAVFVLVVLIFVIYFANYKPVTASLDLIQALTPRATAAENLNWFKKVFALNTFGSGEAREQLINSTLNNLAKSDVAEPVKQQFGNLAVEQIKGASDSAKGDARTLYFFGNFFSSVGMDKEAEIYLNQAKDLAPKKQQIIFSLISFKARAGKLDEALSLAKNVYELDPTYSEARKIYALVAIMSKQTDLANTIIEPMGTSSDYFLDDRFLAAFRETKNDKNFAAILEERKKWFSQKIKDEPKNTQNYISLAEAEGGLGNFEGAKATIKKAIEVNPDFKTQGEEYLKKIDNQ